jgi:uracil DNA glycosylase
MDLKEIGIQYDDETDRSVHCSAYAQLRKATVVFVKPVYPSVRMERPGSHWMDFHEIWYFAYFSKIRRENSSFVKIGQEQRVLCMKVTVHSWSYVAHFCIEWAIFQTTVVEEVSNVFTENRTVFEIMWGKYGTVKQATDANIIQRMHFAK